jgi:hypothetical protein
MRILICLWFATLVLLQSASSYAQSASYQASPFQPEVSIAAPFKLAQAQKVCHLDSRCTRPCWARFERHEISRAEAMKCQSGCCRVE